MITFHFHSIRRIEDLAARPARPWGKGESFTRADPAAGYADVEREPRGQESWLACIDADDAARLRDPAGKPTWHTGQPSEGSMAGDGGDGANANDYRALVDLEAD